MNAISNSSNLSKTRMLRKTGKLIQNSLYMLQKLQPKNFFGNNKNGVTHNISNDLRLKIE